MVSLPFFIGMWYNTGKILCKGVWTVQTIYIDYGEVSQSGPLVPLGELLPKGWKEWEE